MALEHYSDYKKDLGVRLQNLYIYLFIHSYRSNNITEIVTCSDGCHIVEHPRPQRAGSSMER